jgi:hypothetical protein
MNIGRTLSWGELISPVFGIAVSSYSVNFWAYNKIKTETDKK